MQLLLTGVAGFIGYHSAKKLLEDSNISIIGVDNLNDYYDPALKESRLQELSSYNNFTFHKIDIADREALNSLVKQEPNISKILHLAAQAGVRYSSENPEAYVTSNLVGHANIIEICRNLKQLEHLVYASSSSVYGDNSKIPFSTKDRTDKPRSLYAATKKANELLTYSYSHLYGIKATGLRFFTVYGPWGRPDMATYIFTKNIIEGKPITLFNNGDMQRDFTYIDDIISGIVQILDKAPDGTPPHKVYNLGNNNPENLESFVHTIEQAIGKKAIINYRDMHPGDVKKTYAEIDETIENFGFKPSVTIEYGIPKFVDWYKKYYSI